MAFPTKLLNEGERAVVSTRTHPKALIGPAPVLLFVARVEQMQLQVSHELHRLSGGDRRDDGA